MRFPLQSGVNYPDFLVVGAAKSGTTSLHRYLASHPEVFVPEIKETWFFHQPQNPNRWILDHYPGLPLTAEEYAAVFASANPDQVCGELTPSYLYYHELSIDGIKAYHPAWEELRIVIILREPLEKIWSHYRYVRNQGIDEEQLDLASALEQEGRRLRENRCSYDVFYRSNTRYYEQVKAYLDTFPHTKVLLFDDLRGDESKVLKELCSFIEIGYLPAPDSKVYNASRPVLRPRGGFTKQLWQYRSTIKQLIPQKVLGRLRQRMMEEERQDPLVMRRLAREFRPEVERLQRLTGLDLSQWLARYDHLLKDN